MFLKAGDGGGWKSKIEMASLEKIFLSVTSTQGTTAKGCTLCFELKKKNNETCFKSSDLTKNEMGVELH